ncbi:hypothetical protein [Helicobacter sp. T3_23-1056]
MWWIWRIYTHPLCPPPQGRGILDCHANATFYKVAFARNGRIWYVDCHALRCNAWQ